MDNKHVRYCTMIDLDVRGSKHGDLFFTTHVDSGITIPEIGDYFMLEYNEYLTGGRVVDKDIKYTVAKGGLSVRVTLVIKVDRSEVK